MELWILHGYQGLRSYLSRGGELLKASGRLFLTFSFSFGSKETFTDIAEETGWSFKVIDETKFSVEIDGKLTEQFANILELIKKRKIK